MVTDTPHPRLVVHQASTWQSACAPALPAGAVVVLCWSSAHPQFPEPLHGAQPNSRRRRNA
jgi:hypothetical protein